MQSNELLQEMIRSRNLSKRKVSEMLGRSRDYTSRMIAGKVSPKASTLAEYGEVLGYDLILRDRETGTEIPIDPPEKP